VLTRAFAPSATVYRGVARPAESDQIFWYVFAGATPELLMMNFEITHAAAGLTFPAVSLQYPVAQPSVLFCTHSEQV